MSSAPADDATIPPSISMPREEEEEANDAIARRMKKITYSRELLLAVGSSEACKVLPAGVDLSNHPGDLKLWACAETLVARSVARARGRQADSESPQPPRESESFQTGAGSKSKPCFRFFSTEGCRFGDNCRFIHDMPGGYQALAKMSILGDPSPAQDKNELAKHLSTGNATLPPMKQSPTGDQAPTAPNPGDAALAIFGASATTAKISVDASLAGAIIGRGGATIKHIARASGARLRIRDHQTDAGLKNLELEGTFHQIKHASDMVMEHLPVPAPAAGSLCGGGQWSSFKTKLCGHFARGSCTYGEGCRFAHSESELRKPVPFPARDPSGGW